MINLGHVWCPITFFKIDAKPSEYRRILFSKLDLLAANPRIASDNYFYGSFIKKNYNLNFLIMSNVFCNYIFIYYRNNHKYNIETIQNTKKM